jgi:hypothetical protein
MRIKIIFAIFNLVLMNQALAQELVYCPEKIECNMRDDIKSCRAFPGGDGLWANMGVTSIVEKGIYTFEKASAPYELVKGRSFNTICSYGFKVNSKITKFIYLSAGEKQKLQAFSTEEVDNEWAMSASENDGVVANCYSNKVSSCPLINS